MENLNLKKIPIAISPKKLHVLANIVRKKKLEDVLRILNFVPNKGAILFRKLLLGTANTLIKKKQNLSNFFVSEFEVNKGLTLKRVIFRAKGVSNRIRKRSSLISCVISEYK